MTDGRWCSGTRSVGGVVADGTATKRCPCQSTLLRVLLTRLRWPLMQGRKKNASASGVTVAGVASAAAQSQAVAKKDATHADFYRFQQREKRRSGGFHSKQARRCLRL